MTKSEYKQFEVDVKAAINRAMADIHRKYSKYVPPEEMRLMVCRILADRSFEAAIEAAEKAMSPARKIDKLIKLMALGHTGEQAASYLVNPPVEPEG